MANAATPQLFDAFRKKARLLGSGTFERAEQRSVSHHAPAFFPGVLPCKNRIGLLLPLNFNDLEGRCVDSTGEARKWASER